MDVYVARQPIFDRRRQVFGYELLFRSGLECNAAEGIDESAATAQVLANTMFGLGLEDILGGKKAFINFGRDLLVNGWESMLAKDRTVIELLENIEPDADVLAACHKLRAAGYTIALDDFVDSASIQPLTRVANYIKVDMRGTTRSEQARLLAAYRSRDIRMLAEKVETQEEYDWAYQLGFDYFQGYFFARPAVMQGKQIPVSKITCIRLLQEAQKVDIDFEALKELISEDVSFSYKLLRFVNSALFPHRTEIRSIMQALLALGEPEIRHWVAVAAIPRMAADKPHELVVHSLLRARFCESVAYSLHQSNTGDAFLSGLFSLLDALLDRPLDQALTEVNLEPRLAKAILGTASDNLSKIIKLVYHYEAGNWEEVDALGRQLGTDEPALSQSYQEAASWAHHVLCVS